MFGLLVRPVVRRRLAEISQGDPRRVLARFGPRSTLTMIGAHELGGTQRGRAAVERWFARLFARLPDLHIEPTHIAVSGLPWRITVVTEFIARAQLEGGRTYCSEGVQVLRMRWGRVSEERLFEDTALLRDALHTMEV